MNCRLKRESFNFDEELKQKINSKKNSVDFDESIIFSSRHNLGGCRDRGQTSASTASITTATSSNEGNIGKAIFENCKLNLYSRQSNNPSSIAFHWFMNNRREWNSSTGEKNS
jgi:hypothetical protein